MHLRFVILSALALTTLGGCVDRQAQQQAKATAAIVSNPVQTVAVKPATETTLIQTLEVQGQVTTSEDSQVGAKTSGKIISVNVKDGDLVKVGQVLATQDTTPLEAELEQANSQVMSAEAALAQSESQLTQAIRNLTVNPERSTSNVDSAEAALRGAQENYNKMLAGARPQERLQAKATLNSAKANLDVQKKQLDRIRTLVNQGALAGSQLDQQEATYESALATYQNAEQALSLIEQGNRSEDIAAAKEQVRQAREALVSAKASKSLDPLYRDQVNAARAAVSSSKAQVDSAKAQVVIARQAIADSVIRSPFDGQVSGNPIQAGSIAGPGTTVARVIGRGGIYFQGNVPSDNIDQIRVGEAVQIQIDALGNKTYPGHVAAISPMGSTIGRLFTVRIAFDGAPGEIRPGMFARGDIQVLTVPNATVIPAISVVTQNGQNFVYLADGNKAKKTGVELGMRQGDVVQVKNLPLGSKVIVEGQDRIANGTAITIQNPVGVASNAGSHHQV
jgi:HlyD family secretion protein